MQTRTGIRLLTLCLLWLGAALLTGCTRAEDPWARVKGGGPRVLVSFPPLYCFAKNVAGDDAKVLCLAVNTSPHEFTYTSQDIIKANRADLFLLNGLGMEPWGAKIARGANNDRLRVVDVGETIPEGDRNKYGHEVRHGDHVHPAGDWDPHAWLGIPQAVLMVEAIRDKLSEAAPAHKEEFAANARRYTEKLQALREHGKEAFAAAKSKNIVAMHDSLSYFAESFGLNVVDNIQRQAGIDASSQDLVRLARECEEHGVRAIIVEPQYSHAAAENLVKMLEDRGVRGVSLVEFNTMETAARGELDADYYLDEMKSNIDRLAAALQ